MITYTVRLSDFVSPAELKRRLGVNPGGAIQKVVDAAIIRECFPYVPFDEGILAGSANTATEIGSGEIIYDTPYARYQYYGEVYGPNIPIVENGTITGYFSPPEKYPTGEKIQYKQDKHPLAGSHWFDRAMADHSKDVLKEAQNAADRGRTP